MVYDFVPIIFIILSLAVIIIVVMRRLPDLKSLDASSITEEREAEVKKRIFTERLARKTDELKAKISPWSKKILKILEAGIKKIYFKVIELEQKYKDREPKNQKDLEVRKDKKEVLFDQAEQLLKEKKFVEAEKIYLEIISLDNKNIAAYQGLGEIYLEKKDNNEALETFIFITKSLKTKKNLTNGERHLLALSYFDLARIYKSLDKFDKAKKHLAQAIKLEPNNPRYLDLMVEICIILKDKILATEYLDRFKKANLENEKIKEFSAKIKEF